SRLSLSPFPYTTLFRSPEVAVGPRDLAGRDVDVVVVAHVLRERDVLRRLPFRIQLEADRHVDERSLANVSIGFKLYPKGQTPKRSEEHTSELQSRFDLV